MSRMDNAFRKAIADYNPLQITLDYSRLTVTDVTDLYTLAGMYTLVEDGFVKGFDVEESVSHG